MDLTKLSYDELSDLHKQIHTDLEKAAKEEPESEWHQSCFAAFYLVCEELQMRQPKNA